VSYRFAARGLDELRERRMAGYEPTTDRNDGKLMMTSAQAREVLGVPGSCDPAVIDAAFRLRARHSHPDHGGSVEQFRRVVEARQTLAAPSPPPLIVIHQPPWWRLILAALSARLRVQRAATPRVH
jgi:hypothetical protein